MCKSWAENFRPIKCLFLFVLFLNKYQFSFVKDAQKRLLEFAQQMIDDVTIAQEQLQVLVSTVVDLERGKRKTKVDITKITTHP